MAESRSNKSKDVLAHLNSGLSISTQSNNAEDGNFSMCKTNASGKLLMDCSEIASVTMDQASSPTAQIEISTSHGTENNSDQMNSESEIDDVALYPGSMEKRKNVSSDKTLSSTEVANVLFAEFEDKLNRALQQFDVQDITEAQRVRAVLKSKNEKLKENIDNLERQLASATLANYLIRNALGCDADAITDLETIQTIRSVNYQEKCKRESIENITENPASKNQSAIFFTGEDTPRKVVASTVKRLYESSIIKLPDNCMKKIKISTEMAVNDKSTDANATIFTLTDDNVKELLDRIIETAGEALDNKDKIAAPNKSRSNKASSKQGTTSSVKRKQPAFVAETSTRKSTRGSRSSTEEALINPIKYFDCEICKKSFYTEKDLNAHSGRKHAGN